MGLSISSISQGDKYSVCDSGKTQSVNRFKDPQRLRFQDSVHREWNSVQMALSQPGTLNSFHVVRSN